MLRNATKVRFFRHIFVNLYVKFIKKGAYIVYAPFFIFLKTFLYKNKAFAPKTDLF